MAINIQRRKTKKNNKLALINTVLFRTLISSIHGLTFCLIKTVYLKEKEKKKPILDEKTGLTHEELQKKKKKIFK